MALKDLKVAVVGGGVCGLTCAIGLAKNGVNVEVYEAAPQFAEIGAGLGIGANAIPILREFGVLKAILAKSDETEDGTFEWFEFRSGLDDHKLIYDYPTRPSEKPFMIHRAAFLDALVEHVDPKVAHFDKRCCGVTPSENDPSLYDIHFEDGTVSQAHVVLGADGIKSSVRSAITGVDTTNNITYSSTVCYRGLVKAEDLKAAGANLNFTKRPIAFCGPDKHIIAFAIKGGSLINVAAFAADHQVAIGDGKLPLNEPIVVPVTTKQLQEAYAGFGPDAMKLLGCVQKADRWAINFVYPALPSYSKGRIAVLGDAAHGMLPHMGAGAGQGLEDAYLLVRLLSHPKTTIENIEAVLKVYDEIRHPRAQLVWDESWKMGRLFDGYGKTQPSPEGIREDIPGLWDFVWGHDLKEDLHDAERRLEASGVFDASAAQL